MEVTTFATGSSGNCHLVQEGGSSLLLDAGISYTRLKQEMWEKDLYSTDLDVVLITHKHKDHSFSAPRLRDVGIPLVMPEEVMEGVKFDRVGLTPAVSEEDISVGPWRVVPLQVDHGEVDCVAYLVISGEGEKLLYLTDASTFNYQLSGLTRVMIECNWQEEILDELLESGELEVAHAVRSVKTHLSLGSTVEILRRQDLSEVKEIALIHLSEVHSNPTECRELVQSEFGIPTVTPGK